METKITTVPPTTRKKIATKQYPYLVTGEELLNSPIIKVPCLWEPYFTQQDLISLTGGSDVGKSSLLRQFAISVVLQEPTFLGSPLNVRYGRALYLATEDNKTTAKYALQNGLTGKNVLPNQLKGLCYLINPDNPYSAIEEQLKLAKTDVVIVDSFGDVFNGNMNDNSTVRTCLNRYQKLSEKYDTLFIFLHHTGKGKENGNPSKNNVIGSQGFEAKMRLVMELKKPDSSNKRNLHFVKGNHLSENLKRQAMLLEFDDKQQFNFLGSNNINQARVDPRHFSTEEIADIMAIAKPLRDNKIAYEKIITELKKKKLENGKLIKVPSKTILMSWFNAVSQSA